MYPQCIVNKTPKRLDENEKLDSMSICGKRDSYYCKWWINPIFTVNHQIENNEELNEFRESDYYEVYEHFTGEVKKESVGWFSKKEVKVSFFYILKNGVGYYCHGEWDHSTNSLRNGFIPLDDHKDALNILIKYDSAEEAISQCELFNSWGNKHGNLIYSTGDSLEAKFRELEKRRAKTTKSSPNSP